MVGVKKSHPFRFRPAQEKLIISRNHSGTFSLFRTLFKPGTGNSGIFKNVLQKQLTAITIFTNYNHFHSISLPHYLLHRLNIMIFFIAGLIFTPKVVILSQELWYTMSWVLSIFDIPIDIFK